MKNFVEISEDADSMQLLKEIKDIIFNFQGQKYKYQSVHEAKRRFYLYYQERGTSFQEYLEKYQNLIDVVEHCGRVISEDPDIIESIIADETVIDDKVKELARDRYLGCTFLFAADRSRFGRFQWDIENDFTQGINNYPKSLTDAYNLLVYWRQDTTKFTPSDNTIGTMFSTTEISQHITCFKCLQKVYYADKCPQKDIPTGDGKVLLHGMSTVKRSYQFTMHHNLHNQSSAIPKTWIFLDNCSTLDIISNGDLLNDIRRSHVGIDVHLIGGTTKVSLTGNLSGYGRVWYHPSGISNILSLANVREKYPITYSCDCSGGKFTIHKHNGDTKEFTESHEGLYYMDMLHTDDQQLVMINTVADQMSKFTNREVVQVKLSRSIQSMIVGPPTEKYRSIIDRNLLTDYLITSWDIAVVDILYGKIYRH